jgi:hypothetical protein
MDAKRKISSPLLTKLEQREDFRAHFTKLREDASFLAREAMRGKITKSVEARDAALDAASGRIEMPDGSVKYIVQDPKAVDALTRWVPELAFPKKTNEGEKPPTIVLHLGGQSAAKLLGVGPTDEDVPDVEYEVIENEKLLEAGDEDG